MMRPSLARALCLASALRVASPLQPGMAYKPQWELPFPRTPAAMHDALFASLSDMIGSGESRIAVDLLDVFGSRPPPAPLMPLQRAPASAAASAGAPPALERVDPFGPRVPDRQRLKRTHPVLVVGGGSPAQR